MGINSNPKIIISRTSQDTNKFRNYKVFIALELPSHEQRNLIRSIKSI